MNEYRIVIVLHDHADEVLGSVSFTDLDIAETTARRITTLLRLFEEDFSVSIEKRPRVVEWSPV